MKNVNLLCMMSAILIALSVATTSIAESITTTTTTTKPTPVPTTFVIVSPSPSTAAVSPASTGSITPNASTSASPSTRVTSMTMNVTSMTMNVTSMTMKPSSSPSSHHVTPTTSMPITPKPTPPKPRYDLNFTVLDSTNKTCLQFHANITVLVDYSGKKTLIPLNDDDGTAASNGSCSEFSKPNDTSHITITWPDKVLTIKFEELKNNWIFSNIDFSMDKFNFTETVGDTIGDITGSYTDKGDRGNFFQAELNKTYYCPIEKSQKLTSNNNTLYNITLQFKSIDVQPFSHSGGGMTSCEPKTTVPSKSSSIVPIAVGCALAGLIVIVLIAYLIGRRKSDNRGYQQV